MATLPTPFIWGDDLFAADPIQQGPFEAGLGACDWTGDNLNGALYMLSGWTAQIVECISFATASDVLTGSNPERIITVGVFDLALCAALFRKGGQTFSAECGSALPATGADGDVFLVLNAAGDAVVSVHLWGNGAWQTMTAGDGTCVKCAGGETWCLDGGTWAVNGGGVVVEPIGPFSAGQNAADWLFFGNGTTVTLPASGPTASGYWEIYNATFDPGDTSVSFAGGATLVSIGTQRGSIGLSPAGGAITFTGQSNPPGDGSIEARWVAT